MTPEQKKMLEEYGVYPQISGGGIGSDRFIAGAGKVGMVAALLNNLNLNAYVDWSGYKTPNSDPKFVYQNYGLGLGWSPDEINNFSFGAEHTPGRYGNEDDNTLSARWKRKF